MRPRYSPRRGQIQLWIMMPDFLRKSSLHEQKAEKTAAIVFSWPSRSNRETMHEGFGFLLSGKKRQRTKKRTKAPHCYQDNMSASGEKLSSYNSSCRKHEQISRCKQLLALKSFIGVPIPESTALVLYRMAALSTPLCTAHGTQSLQAVSLHLNITFICC